MNYHNYFCNFDIRRTYFRSEMKSKTLVFALHFTHLFVTLRQNVAKILHLGIKKKLVSFVLLSIFRNFALSLNTLSQKITKPI